VMAFDSKNKKYKCFSCNASYDIFDHYQQHYNLSFLEAIKTIIKDFSLNIYIEENKTIRKANKKPSVYSNNVDNVMDYISKREISKATVDYVGVKADKGNVVFEYRNERGEHISNKFRPARKLDKKDLKMWFEKDTNINTLFNMDKIDMSKSLTICEGEFDCLSLIEAGIKNSVSVPTGASSSEWIEANWDFLEQFEEIIVWFDNDEAGKKGIRNISNRLNNVKIVNMSSCKDINELLFKHGKEAVAEQYKKAEYPAIDDVTEFDDIEDYNVYEAENIKTGFKKLDNVMYGFVEGTLNVFTGNSGAGKSTLVNQMCILESIHQNNKCFIFSGELTKGNLKYWITHTLANNEDIEMVEREDGTQYSKVSAAAKSKMSRWLKNKLYIYDNDFDFSYTSILSKMEQLAKRYGVKVFILDNLMTIDLGNSQDKYEAEKIFINALKKFALTYNAIVHLVAHPRKTAKGEVVSKLDIAGSANITNLADYVTTITRVDKTEEEGVKFEHDAIFSVEKNRPTGVQNKNVGLNFDTHRRRFYINNQELNKNFYDNEFIKVQGEF
ncbi:DnaB-like helicase C-terminal domain-containing protein, partial [Romboutsia sp.]|uniref:DnaB-like helicase C-terminal domain-containing protein n=1 Tax=Romboutsia sp. TaxID=1965302 RepID=UPI002BEBE90A